MGDTFAFFHPHECYHLGQLGLVPRMAGLRGAIAWVGRAGRRLKPAPTRCDADSHRAMVGAGFSPRDAATHIPRGGLPGRSTQQSGELVRDRFANLPSSPLMASPGRIAADAMTVSMVEGWLGEICHVAITDDLGRCRRYKIVDPSFLNWFGLAVALRGQQISDLPLCNKSFNLSYCGHDL